VNVLSDGSISRWVRDLQNGNIEAAQALWERYYRRLVGLAKKKLGEMPRRIADEDDVVNHAFHSFCQGVSQGRFPKLDDRHDLWQILVMLTARKAADQIKTHYRKKRGAALVHEEPTWNHLGEQDLTQLDQVVGIEPSPDFAAQMVEDYRSLLNKLGDPVLCEVAICKMEGYSNSEIAERLNVHPRTIDRKLRVIRALWIGESDNSTDSD
jgi:DNA-directed RNA polymerase specialized sigma24 family protein